MIMKKEKCVRTIKVTNENKKKLAQMFGCSMRMVYKALCFEADTPLTRKIQHTARKEMGGWIEATVPEDEIFYDTMDGGEHIMRRYFGNGALVEISTDTSVGSVMFKGKTVKHYDRVDFKDVPGIQAFAASLR